MLRSWQLSICCMPWHMIVLNRRSMDGSRILNQKGLAHLLGIDRTTIHRWHAKQIGPPRILIKKRYYYVIGSVEQWLKTLNDLSLKTLVSVDETPTLDQPSPTNQSRHPESVL